MLPPKGPSCQEEVSPGKVSWEKDYLVGHRWTDGFFHTEIGRNTLEAGTAVPRHGGGGVRYSRQLHVARMLGAAGRGPWEVDEARAQGASCARLRSQGFSLWAAWPGGGQRAGIPTVAPSGSWGEAVLYWAWLRLKPRTCWP